MCRLGYDDLGVYSIQDFNRQDRGAEVVKHCAVRPRPQMRVDKYFPLKDPTKP